MTNMAGISTGPQANAQVQQDGISLETTYCKRSKFALASPQLEMFFVYTCTFDFSDMSRVANIPHGSFVVWRCKTMKRRREEIDQDDPELSGGMRSQKTSVN